MFLCKMREDAAEGGGTAPEGFDHVPWDGNSSAIAQSSRRDLDAVTETPARGRGSLSNIGSGGVLFPLSAGRAEVVS